MAVKVTDQSLVKQLLTTFCDCLWWDRIHKKECTVKGRGDKAEAATRSVIFACISLNLELNKKHDNMFMLFLLGIIYIV